MDCNFNFHHQYRYQQAFIYNNIPQKSGSIGMHLLDFILFTERWAFKVSELMFYAEMTLLNFI